MKKKNFGFPLLGTALLALLFFASCTPTDGFEGPGLNDLYGEFEVIQPLSISGDNADFSTGSNMVFSAEVNLNADWKLEITGLQSGAVKVIEGRGKIVEAVWDGSTTELPVFQSESVLAMLTFPGQEDTLSTSATVAGPKTNEGVLVADFNDGNWNPQWNNFFQSGINFAPAQDHETGEGDYYLSMDGVVSWDWLIGQVEFTAVSLPGDPDHFPLPASPQGLYFNVMVYGDATRPNTLLKFEFREDEDGNGSHESNAEDRYDYELNVDWDGWRLLSIPYADLTTPADPQWGGGNGNKIQEPDKIVSIQVLLLADPSSGPATSDLDYLIWTTNGPLQP